MLHKELYVDMNSQRSPSWQEICFVDVANIIEDLTTCSCFYMTSKAKEINKRPVEHFIKEERKCQILFYYMTVNNFEIACSVCFGRQYITLPTYVNHYLDALTFAGTREWC